MADRQNKKHIVIGFAAAFSAICVVVIAVSVFTNRNVNIDEKTFPDEVLREYVSTKVDKDGDGALSLAEAGDVRIMVIEGAREISGLSVFPNLTTLVSSGESLESVELDGASSLSRVDLSGAVNLSQLIVNDVPNLRNVDLRGTKLSSVDFSGASQIDQVLVDESTVVTGLVGDDARKQSLPVHFSGKSTGSVAYEAGDYEISATYDSDGRLKNRDISGDIQAEIVYTYDENGWLRSVEVKDTSTEMDNSWSISYSEQAVLASGEDGSYVKRFFDSKGKLASLSLNTMGIQGPVQGDIALQYDARGFLDAVVVTADGQSVSYDVECNGAGGLETVSSEDGLAEFLAFSGSTLTVDGVMSSDWSSVGRLTADGLFWGSLSSDGEGNTSRLVGKFGSYAEDGAEDGASTDWGKIASPDASVQYQYYVDNRMFNPTVSGTPSVDAVSLVDKTKPSPYVDYWFVDGMDTVVKLAIKEATQNQWSMGSTDPMISISYDNTTLTQYESHLADIATELGIDYSKLRYALVNMGYTDYPQLLVCDADGSDSLLAIYEFVDGEVQLVKKADDGLTMQLCGGGFLKTADDQGNISIDYFTGISFDEVAHVKDSEYYNIFLGLKQPDDGSGVQSLEVAYPSAMASISWRSLSEN